MISAATVLSIPIVHAALRDKNGARDMTYAALQTMMFVVLLTFPSHHAPLDAELRLLAAMTAKQHAKLQLLAELRLLAVLLL